MGRIPIRIYKLLEPLYEGDKEVEISIEQWDYIQGKTLADVSPNASGNEVAFGVIEGNYHIEGEVELTKDNIDGATWEGIRFYAVYFTRGETSKKPDGYYISHENKKYYFLPNAVATPATPSNEVFEFYVNPERITPTYRKLITETRTRGGWDVQHWGEQLTEIRVEGRTGGLIKQAPQTTPATLDLNATVRAFDITQSIAWKRLNQLKRLYDEDHKVIDREGFVTKLGFNFYDKFYVGYFSDFSGPNADAEKPYIMNYSFTFKVESGGEYQMDSSFDSLKTQQEILGAD